MARIKVWRASPVIFLVSSVSINPGATAFTSTLREASSFDTDLVRPIRPALEAVVGLALVARDADDARDVDDPAPATLDHPPGRVLGHQEGALQVRVEHGAPVVLVDPEQQVVPRRARVVHEDVDLAELPLDRADRGLDLSRVRDVARKAPRRGVPERARRLLGLGAVPGQHRHLGTGAREGLRDRVTDAAAAPGDDPPLAGEIDLHPPPRVRSA